MKTMLLASAAIFGLTIGSAFAEEGDSVQPISAFTNVPGVVAQPAGHPVTAAEVARDRAYAAATAKNHGTWLFPVG